MPVLTGRLNGQGQAPNGSIVPLPPGYGLAHMGPRCPVTIGVAQAVAEELQKLGKAIPVPVSGQALIDTGASITCIDDEEAQKMQLPVVGVVSLSTPSHESIEKKVYPIQLQISGSGITLEIPRSAGADLKAQGLLALIGRDVLSQCLLVYNGSDDSFTLAR